MRVSGSSDLDQTHSAKRNLQIRVKNHMGEFLAGNGNRRLGLDRRVFSYFSHIPERRGGSDRRSGTDRRNRDDRPKLKSRFSHSKGDAVKSK